MSRMFAFVRISYVAFFFAYMLTSCIGWPSAPKVDSVISGIERSSDSVVNLPIRERAENQKDQLTLDLAFAFRWGAIVCVLATVILLVLSFKIPALAHLCVFSGAGAVLCMVGLYSLSYIWFIVGALFWGLVIYAGFKIYSLIEERNEEREVSKDLAIHFDDTEGGAKLSEKAKKKYNSNKKEKE